MKKRILVIEDDEDINFIYEDVLNKKYDVTYVKNAEDGEKELKQNNFDLVLLDIILPGKTGDEFFKEIRSKQKFKNLKIIVVSILSDVMEQLDRIDPKITCLRKPFDEKKLLSLIEEKLK